MGTALMIFIILVIIISVFLYYVYRNAIKEIDEQKRQKTQKSLTIHNIKKANALTLKDFSLKYLNGIFAIANVRIYSEHPEQVNSILNTHIKFTGEVDNTTELIKFMMQGNYIKYNIKDKMLYLFITEFSNVKDNIYEIELITSDYDIVTKDNMLDEMKVL